MTSPIKMFFPILGKDMEFQNSGITLTIKRLPAPGDKLREGVTVVSEAGCDCKSKKHSCVFWPGLSIPAEEKKLIFHFRACLCPFVLEDE